MAIDFDATVLAACINTFGEPGTYIPFQYARFTVNGVFDEAYTDARVVEGMLVTTVTPVFGIRLSDFPNPPLQNDHLILRGKAYKVREVRVDGHGSAKLMLNLDSDYIWH